MCILQQGVLTVNINLIILVLQTTDPMDQGSSGVFFTIGGGGGGECGHHNHIRTC